MTSFLAGVGQLSLLAKMWAPRTLSSGLPAGCAQRAKFFFYATCAAQALFASE